MSQPLTAHRVSFGSLGFFSRLYREYCDDFGKLASFYAVDYRSVEGRAAAAKAAASHPRDRKTLVEVLRQQNARWGPDGRVDANLEALLNPESVAVVTGQQLGLFGGPLYTVYKTLTVLQMAERLSDETGRPVVPVFWLEGEDHDFEEIASVSVLAGNEIRSLRYSGHELPTDGNLGPVGRLVLTDEIRSAVQALDDALPPTDFKPSVMEAVRAAYAPGATMLDAFASMMRYLFRGRGLVMISADDRRLKQLVAPLFERDLSDGREVASRVETVSEELRSSYHAQVTIRPSNLFMLDEEGRHAIDATNGSFRIRGGDVEMTRDEVLSRLNHAPDVFSPNVVLRPLVQDTLLPTAIYVGGPSEIAYFAQFKPVYEWAGVPMPAIYPRASATVVEGKVQKVLNEANVTVADLDGDLERLFQRLVREQMSVDLDAHFSTASQHLHEAMNQLRPVLEEVDRTLLKSAEATRAVLLKEMDKFRHRVLKAEKRNHEQVREKLRKAQGNLFPGGKPQERALSMLYFLNKYGADFVQRLHDALSLDTGSHQILTV